MSKRILFLVPYLFFIFIFIIILIPDVSSAKLETSDYLLKIIENDSNWSVVSHASKKIVSDCQDGKIIRLIEPAHSYLIGTRISFFDVNESEKTTKELLHPGCDIKSKTTYTNNILENKTYKICKKIKTEISTKKIIFKSEIEFEYIKNKHHCVYKADTKANL